jgi:hypothetical protein
VVTLGQAQRRTIDSLSQLALNFARESHFDDQSY